MKTKDRDKFREFVKTLKEEQVGHWVEIAKAVGTSEATISRWKNLPEAQEAIKIAIMNTVDNMENAGKKDWRMWETKLKMLGVNPAQKIQADVKVNDATKQILDKFGLGGDDAGQDTEA